MAFLIIKFWDALLIPIERFGTLSLEVENLLLPNDKPAVLLGKDENQCPSKNKGNKRHWVN